MDVVNKNGCVVSLLSVKPKWLMPLVAAGIDPIFSLLKPIASTRSVDAEAI
jgi:hypothetical protein